MLIIGTFLLLLVSFFIYLDFIYFATTTTKKIENLINKLELKEKELNKLNERSKENK